MAAALDELLQFLQLNSNPELKLTSLLYLSGVSIKREGKQLFKENTEVLDLVMRLALHDNQKEVSREAFAILINLSADREFCQVLMEKYRNRELCELLRLVCIEQYSNADLGAMLLSNLSSVETECEMHYKMLEDCGCTGALLDRVYNEDKLEHLDSFLANLTQLQSVRQMVLQNRELFMRILAHIQWEKTSVRRRAAVTTVKNCCFESAEHNWLLSSEVDLLSRLLLPLAGPEEFDEIEMDKLPVDLQYLPTDKQREEDPEIRQMLLDTMLQLCATKLGRSTLKNSGCYYILRELHKWECNTPVLLACENLVHLLIGDEPDDSITNMKTVDVPDDIRVQLEANYKERLGEAPL